MESASVCPKCGYQRKPGDTAPAWQCPSCGIAMEKYRARQEAGRPQSPLAAGEASKAAMAAAAANPLTAVLVREAGWVELPPRLSFDRRLGMALFDLLTALVFLWCWLNPGAWRPTLAQELGLIILMEFFVIHSSAFLAAGSGSGEGASGAKITLAFVVMLVYLPVAGAFAWWHGGGWWPVFAFAWLLSSRVAAMFAGQGGDAFESKRARYYWATGGALYILCGFAVVFLPIPQLGFRRYGQFVWDGFWTLPPQDVIAWGFLYFGLNALVKLLEKPEWIAEQR